MWTQSLFSTKTRILFEIKSQRLSLASSPVLNLHCLVVLGESANARICGACSEITIAEYSDFTAGIRALFIKKIVNVGISLVYF